MVQSEAVPASMESSPVPDGLCSSSSTLSQSRMSRHMVALKTAGLVVDRRDAQWVRYRRSPNLPQEVIKLVDAALVLSTTQERHAA